MLLRPALMSVAAAVCAAGFVLSLWSSPARAADPLPGLRVSENKRFLVTDAGRPFFYLADTAWELFHRLSREEADRYLTDRAGKGFTVVQAVVLAEMDGLTDPNPYGHVPFAAGPAGPDPGKPNEDYFKHVDWVVDRAGELGLYVGVLPTWGDKWNKKWGAGPAVFDAPEKAGAYGRWLGERYKDRANVIWIVGGDRPIETDLHRAVVAAMARGLRAGDGGRHLVTFHPNGGASSVQWFAGPAHDWLDFHMRQNGHVAEHTGRYDKTAADYARLNGVAAAATSATTRPATGPDAGPAAPKPLLDGEPVYEDHPLSFDAKKLGHSTAADVRRPLYWNLFAGACGHTYGHHSVWQMYDARREPKNAPLMTWAEALGRPGAGQMQHGRRLMESRPVLTRVPDDGLIVPAAVPTAVPGAGRYRFAATRDEGGTYAMVYAPVGRPFAVRTDRLKAARVKAWWFDPRTGAATAAGEFDNAAPTRAFTSPDAGDGLDWVLVLDDAGKNYPPPGQPAGR